MSVTFSPSVPRYMAVLSSSWTYAPAVCDPEFGEKVGVHRVPRRCRDARRTQRGLQGSEVHARCPSSAVRRRQAEVQRRNHRNPTGYKAIPSNTREPASTRRAGGCRAWHRCPGPRICVAKPSGIVALQKPRSCRAGSSVKNAPFSPFGIGGGKGDHRSRHRPGADVAVVDVNGARDVSANGVGHFEVGLQDA